MTTIKETATTITSLYAFNDWEEDEEDRLLVIFRKVVFNKRRAHIKFQLLASQDPIRLTTLLLHHDGNLYNEKSSGDAFIPHVGIHWLCTYGSIHNNN